MTHTNTTKGVRVVWKAASGHPKPHFVQVEARVPGGWWTLVRHEYYDTAAERDARAFDLAIGLDEGRYSIFWEGRRLPRLCEVVKTRGEKCWVRIYDTFSDQQVCGWRHRVWLLPFEQRPVGWQDNDLFWREKVDNASASAEAR